MADENILFLVSLLSFVPSMFYTDGTKNN